MIESAVETFGIKRTQCMIFNGLCRPEEPVNLTCNVEGEKEKKEGKGERKKREGNKDERKEREEYRIRKKERR